MHDNQKVTDYMNIILLGSKFLNLIEFDGF